MPSGRVAWLDPKSDDGRIVHLGRRYPVRTTDMDPEARRPDARVWFDVDRREGIARAVNVRLVQGTRVSRRQRRFGFLSGAKHPDEAGHAATTHTHSALHHHPADDRPRAVAQRWVGAMSRGDVGAAASMYAPDARVHEGERTYHGTRRIQTYLSGCPALRLRTARLTAGAQPDTVVVEWSTDRVPSTTRVRVSHGEIAEQWIGG